MNTSIVTSYKETPSIENFNHLMDILLEKKFTISDLNLSARVTSHWKKFGIIPGEDGKWMKLDLFQLIWVEIVKDLREFGMHLPKIKKLMEFILPPISMFDLVDVLKENPHFLDSLNNPLVEKGKELRELIQELFLLDEQTLKSKLKGLNTLSLFQLKILLAIVTNLEFSLLVDQDGKSQLSLFGESKSSPSNLMQNSPYITLPLNRYVNKFIVNTASEENLKEYRLLQKDEIKILSQIRRGDLKELKVIFGNDGKSKDIVLICTGSISENELINLAKSLRGRKYSELKLTTRDGNSVHYEYTQRKRV